MNTAQKVAAFAGVALLALPFAASAQVYYYAPNTMSGPYISNSYDSYIPAAAMPYVEMGEQQQQSQQQYEGYSYPTQTQYQSQSQSQYQTSPYQYTSYSQPTYQYSYPSYQQTITPTQLGEEGGEYASAPQTYSYSSGTTGPFGEQMCYYSDSTTYEPCGRDPQQWVQDPYTGDWY